MLSVDMTTDLDTMAARLVDDVDNVRCCVILSADGAVLSATPAERATAGSDIWARFRALGPPRRGFVLVGEEVWAVVHQGERAGILVADDSTPPGLLLERLEMLVAASRNAPVPAEIGASPQGSMLSNVTPGEVAEAAEAVLQAQAQPAPPAADAEVAAGRSGEGRVEPVLGHPDPDVDPMALVREFAWLQEDRRTGN